MYKIQRPLCVWSDRDFHSKLQRADVLVLVEEYVLLCWTLGCYPVVQGNVSCKGTFTLMQSCSQVNIAWVIVVAQINLETMSGHCMQW